MLMSRSYPLKPSASPLVQSGAQRTPSGWRNTLLLTPSVASLFLWTTVPTAMTLWFSFQRYNLVNLGRREFSGLENYVFFLTSPSFAAATWNSILVVTGVLALTLGVGVLLAIALNADFPGRSIARVLAISPFFIMPTVAALIWKNLLMHPSSGLFSAIGRTLGLPIIDWFGTIPLFSVVLIVSWQWIGFSTLILLTSLQSLSKEIKEAAQIDGAGPLAMLRYVTLPHLGRPMAIVVMIESIFLLSVFAEIFVTTSGGPGVASTNLAFLIYIQALLRFDVGLASAGGVVSIVLANIVAFFLVRTIARALEI